MKVEAQYEVLGNDAKRQVRPVSRHFEAVINLTVGKGAWAKAIGNGNRVEPGKSRLDTFLSEFAG
jgi:hypothetical protein